MSGDHLTNDIHGLIICATTLGPWYPGRRVKGMHLPLTISNKSPWCLVIYPLLNSSSIFYDLLSSFVMNIDAGQCIIGY